MKKPNFKIALGHLLESEGIYSNDPVDAGGETCFGISRHFWPIWPGWSVVDHLLRNKVPVPEWKKDQGLMSQVASFYKVRFWDAIWGDVQLSGKIAEKMFEMSVNMGTSRVVGWVQTALNFLNKQEKLWLDLVVDGMYGRKTNDALRNASEISSKLEDAIILCLEAQQTIH